MNHRISRSALVLTIALAAGCIRAPDVVMVDRKTMLEEQASGELRPLENDLREAAIVPKGEDFTRAQLQEAGIDLSDDALSSIVQIHGIFRTEADFLDDLLVRRCIGEGLHGLLVETPRHCAGKTNSQRTTTAVERVNRSRRQLWRYLEERSPEVPSESLRSTWRRHHLKALVCGGQLETAPDRWEPKRC